MVRNIQLLGHAVGTKNPANRRALLPLIILAFLPIACSPIITQRTSNFDGATPSSRLISVALWVGLDKTGSGVGLAAPTIVRQGPVTISGPIHLPHPVTGEIALTYERVATTPQGPRRQLLSQTHEGAGLGRLLDERAGLPARKFSGDLVFPLGNWHQGERRSFVATEHTDLGPARRQITIVIAKIDFSYRDVPHSMAYVLTIADAAGRILTCERYVYSPGVGLAAFETAGIGPDGNGCDVCPCPAALAG
ncbi:MAG TPA: hypothetical protein VMY41_17835 [Thermohalobaculum sp.]|nr:hypothetical protein [Thermohalobaculum sp.]